MKRGSEYVMLEYLAEDLRSQVDKFTLDREHLGLDKADALIVMQRRHKFRNAAGRYVNCWEPMCPGALLMDSYDGG